MLEKLFASLYNTVFVNIVIGATKTTVYIEVCNKKKVIESAEEVFETDGVTSELQEFIKDHTADSPFSYISYLDIADNQGALPTCEKSKIPYYNDLSASISKCYDKKWTYFSSQEDIYTLERKYQNIGVDYIFSPFVLMANFFRDKVDNHMAMFVVVQDGSISLSVFNKTHLLFAEHLDISRPHDEDELIVYDDEIEDIDLLDESVELDDIDAIEEIDSFEDFGDIEDLDGIEETEDFLESTDVEEEFHQEFEEEELPSHEADGFNEDYQRFLLIQSSINGYYKDSKYDSEFIQTIYIADGVGVSQDLKRYLEEEMFLDVYIRQIDLASSVCDLAKMELGYEV